MRTIRPLLLVLAALAAVAVFSEAARAAVELRLTELTGARFPDRAFVLTLPEPVVLDPSRVTVRENGEGVEALTVLPATAAAQGEFAVVLVIDASKSMRGPAIEGAVEAARAFAALRG
jgi:hypothetical protein